MLGNLRCNNNTLYLAVCDEMAGNMLGYVKKSCQNWQCPEILLSSSCHRPFSGQNGSVRKASCAADGCFRQPRTGAHVGWIPALNAMQS